MASKPALNLLSNFLAAKKGALVVVSSVITCALARYVTETSRSRQLYLAHMFTPR